MNFSELAQIVKYLKKTVPCNSCQAHYDPADIEVLSTFDDQGLFNLKCPKCHNQLLVHITISDEERNLSEPKSTGTQMIRGHRAITESIVEHHTYSTDMISTNDVIDMHSFLGQFNGDFKRLFSNKH